MTHESKWYIISIKFALMGNFRFTITWNFDKTEADIFLLCQNIRFKADIFEINAELAQLDIQEQFGNKQNDMVLTGITNNCRRMCSYD
jgi:hypothetical protein